MTESLLPGRTEEETHQYLLDHGHRVAAVQAYHYIGRLIETDDTFPLPPGAEDVIAAAAKAMQDVYARHKARRQARAEAYVAVRLAEIHAAVAEDGDAFRAKTRQEAVA